MSDLKEAIDALVSSWFCHRSPTYSKPQGQLRPLLVQISAPNNASNWFPANRFAILTHTYTHTCSRPVSLNSSHLSVITSLSARLTQTLMSAKKRPISKRSSVEQTGTAQTATGVTGACAQKASPTTATKGRHAQVSDCVHNSSPSHASTLCFQVFFPPQMLMWLLWVIRVGTHLIICSVFVESHGVMGMRRYCCTSRLSMHNGVKYQTELISSFFSSFQ